MRTRHRTPSIFNLSMVDVLCCALGCVILLWLLNLKDAKQRALAVGETTDRLKMAQSTLDLTAANLRWKYGRSVPQLPSVLAYRGVLYMINDGGVLSTFTAATGALIHQSRLRGAIDHYYASPVAADGKVFIASQSGIVTVLKAGGEYEVLSSVQLDDECYATPAIADGRIYIRTRSALYCFGRERKN